MPTAKSYEKFWQLSEPYDKDGRLYVRVKGACPRCGGSGHYSYNQMDGTICYGCRGSGIQILEVRWYTDSQRASMDKSAERRKVVAQEKRLAAIAYRQGPVFNGFGDENGSIVIFGGDTYTHREELRSAGCRYNDGFGWYAPAGVEVEVPDGCCAKTITWSEVSKDNVILTTLELKAIVAKLFNSESNSTYQGVEGEKITVSVIVRNNFEFCGRYGVTHLHVFEDENGNIYTWSTSTKNINKDTKVTITGTVKEHTEYKGVKQTVLTRCRIKGENNDSSND